MATAGKQSIGGHGGEEVKHRSRAPRLQKIHNDFWKAGRDTGGTRKQSIPLIRFLPFPTA